MSMRETPSGRHSRRSPKRLTIGDIAAMAGVGKATVSRVINNSGYVSPATRARVEKVVADTVFMPSAAARALSRRESDTVGVIIPEAGNAFFWGLLKGIGGVADAHNLSLIFCNSDNRMEKDIASFQAMFRQRVKGVLYTPAVAYNTPERLALLREQLDKLDAPVVLMDRPIDGLELDGVYSDNYAGAYSATEELIKAGHRKIGMLTGDPALRIGSERLRGFKSALRDHGVPLKRQYLVKGMFNTETAYRNSVRLLESSDLPSAVFAANNLSGIGFLQALSERGMTTPGDMGFISFDHLGLLGTLHPGLSYLDRDVVGMGAEALRLLLAKNGRRGAARGDIVFPSSAVLLGSEKKGRGGQPFFRVGMVPVPCAREQGRRLP